jgi:uncharacterized protein (TIGR00369 family)
VASEQTDPAELIRAFFDHSPFGRKIGLELVDLQADRCRLRLPYDESLATYGEVVHGGATATLVDVAATVAAWSNPREPVAGGATVDLTVHYLRAAEGTDLVATASVTRRGREICAVDVEVAPEGSDEFVAKALVAYKLRVRKNGG